MFSKVNKSGVAMLLKAIMLEEVPSYANKIFYSLGFLSMISFFMLLITGLIMVFFGIDWWLTNSAGVFMRSIHLWSGQAFVVFMILHITIVFLTSGYKPPRRLVWVFGSLMFFLALIEAEFGYVLRNDFSAQWRSLQGADLYNGSGLGIFINNLNYAQIYGIHIVLIPFIILGILFLHYGLVRLRGIAKPYRPDYKYRMVKANHTVLFVRGFVLITVIILLAIIFPSPLIAPVTIKQIATESPSTMAKTLLSEIDHSSDTATYSDNIAPYQFDTKKIYIDVPYLQYTANRINQVNMLAIFDSEDKSTQTKNLKAAGDYFAKNGELTLIPNTKNPVLPLVSSLIYMAQSGLYEAALKNEANTGYNQTYALRFLSDAKVLEDKANSLQITTAQYGMLREETGIIPPGAWWLAPLGLIDNTILKNDPNQDRDGAEIIGTFMLIFIAFPYIPLINQLPDKLKIYKLIWKDKDLERN
ncbi:MAG TPA: cytochrome b N-terminal domain-containing protein [Patescibacteria group bacterium]